MAQKIIITAKQVTLPTDAAFLFFGLNFGNGAGSYLYTGAFFVTSNSNFADGWIKYNHANINLFAAELKAYFEYQFTNAGVPYVSEIAGNEVYFYLGNNTTVDYFNYLGNPTLDYDLWSIRREDYTFTELEEDIVIPNENNLTSERIILSRSPYFFNVTPGVTFDKVTYYIRIWKGNKTFNKPIDATYQTSKYVVIAGQSTISINISNLINDFVKNRILETFVTTGSSTISLNDSIWCEVIADVQFNDTHLFNITQTFFAVDGFGYYTELYNTDINTRVLSSINKHIIYRGADYPLYFLTKDLVSITVNGGNVPFTYSQDESNQLIGFVNVGEFVGVDTSFIVELEYDNETITHSFEVKDECRFVPINCFFKNKFGVWQSIPFNKQNKRNITSENKEYIGLQSSFGAYNVLTHGTKTYLHNLQEVISCNTDFLPEIQVTLFEELMLSEFIYLEENGTYLPVNINTKSIEKKTKLTNKLIQYSMDFKYSFNKMNTVI